MGQNFNAIVGLAAAALLGVALWAMLSIRLHGLDQEAIGRTAIAKIQKAAVCFPENTYD